MNEFELTEYEIQRFSKAISPIIEKALEIKLRAILEEYGLNKVKSETLSQNRWVQMKDLCQILKVSKQTVHNWKKHPLTISMLRGNVKNLGRKVFYDVEAIKYNIRRNPEFFGLGKSYEYYNEVNLSENQKKTKRFFDIKFAIENNQEVSEGDREFYDEEVYQREKENTAIYGVWDV